MTVRAPAPLLTVIDAMAIAFSLLFLIVAELAVGAWRNVSPKWRDKRRFDDLLRRSLHDRSLV